MPSQPEEYTPCPWPDYDVLFESSDCALAWMPYPLGDILPASAAHTGYMTGVRHTYTAQIYRPDCDSVEFSIYVPDDSVAAHYPYIGDQFSAIFEIAKVWYGIDTCGNEAIE